MISSTEHFFVQLLGTRDNWPNDMTEDEEKIMTEHFHYLKDLVQQKKVLMAGPVFEPVFGLVIVQAESKAEARALAGNDPAVINGLMTVKISPMRVSLMAENPPDREPQ